MPAGATGGGLACRHQREGRRLGGEERQRTERLRAAACLNSAGPVRSRGMSWAQAALLARGLSRGWGGLCRAILRGAPFSQVAPLALRGLHRSAAACSSDLSLVPSPPESQRRPIKVPEPHEELFKQAPGGERDKASFVRAVRLFGQQDVRRRGHVDFIYLALRKMREFGVQRDLAVYNLLLDVFPKEVFRPRNVFQRMFVHYPRQQECGVAVLEQMEQHGVMPDTQTEFLLTQIFGRRSYPMLKLMSLPSDPGSPEEPAQPHIVGIQSPDQQAALARHNPARPIFVEGPFSLWLRDKCVYYHILRADLLPPEERDVEEVPEEWNLFYPMQLDLEYSRGAWDDYEFDIDEVEEGPIFAMCIAGAHDQATLAKWIQGLQEANPALAQIPVVFRLAGPAGELLTSAGLEEPPPPRPEAQEEEEVPQRQQQGQS
ncbi:evolutionarily conserved signaling intermediate in Toll pathway, mitochondrial isoform X3 [Lepus europaeus]|uniref:evolutionarily conserved signaling intermediate in Toll pathway, mitochondrial isoform X3 n=1 Tax=Lepus europaeus TaxID=9983 RepID=UPI002B472770|nr:evolutionarily conserved signaling intermediate in Toll pathway, mitochondrial isoform X3 [Lepus europaeus]